MKTGTPEPFSGQDSVIIAVAAGAVLGLILVAGGDSSGNVPAPIQSVNDLSRWATVYSLVERGTYDIDSSPWPPTIDRVRINGHFYSSKPPLLPTLLAGEYYLLKKLSFGKLSLQANPEAVVRIVVATFNWLPFLAFLILYSRLFRHLTQQPWVSSYSVAVAAFGTLITAFCVTLNNHTIAAFSAAFALYAGCRIWCGDTRKSLFATSGFFSGFAAVNEFPALAFLALGGAGLFWKAPRRTMTLFVPLALVPVSAHFVTNYLAVGSLSPAYAQKQAYEFPGSYWKVDPETGRLVSTTTDPTTGRVEIRKNIDSLYEPWPVYLFHMVIGHHGILSLSPVLLFSFVGLLRLLRDRSSPIRALALLAALLTLLLLVFYIFFAGQRNYGGATAGLRWLFWLIPFWLLCLPAGLERGAAGKGFRMTALMLLAASALSVLYAARNPWSKPWIHKWLSYMAWIWY
jgi:hypothetical protein